MKAGKNRKREEKTVPFNRIQILFQFIVPKKRRILFKVPAMPNLV
jgi:hypothetical protein